MLEQILLTGLGAWLCGLLVFCWYSYFQGKKSESLPQVRDIGEVRLLMPLVFIGLSYANAGGAAPLWAFLVAVAVVNDLLPSRFRRWGWRRRQIAQCSS